MEEDEVGLRNELGHVSDHAVFVQCARCGRPIPERSAVVAPADALEDGEDSRLLCPACSNELADGEQDLPLTPE